MERATADHDLALNLKSINTSEHHNTASMNRSSLSIRRKHDDDTPSSPKHRFTMGSLRGIKQPELSKKLFKLIKSENHAITAYETAGRERLAIASQLSEWGDSVGDDTLSEVSDKLGVLLAEIAEQEDGFAQNLEEYRGVLKQIRNTEASVQPTRDSKTKISDELAKLKYKEPASTKIAGLEQELVRAEAQSLVAEAQLTNITRQKFREAYAIHLAAVLERSEKQALLAKQAQKLLYLIDDTPIVPGQEHPPFKGAAEAGAIMAEAQTELQEWTPSWEEIRGSHTGADGMPLQQQEAGHESHVTHAAHVPEAVREEEYEDAPTEVAPSTMAEHGSITGGHSATAQTLNPQEHVVA